MYVKQLPAGTMGRISWERLAELFSKVGETKPYERLTHFTADERGITFRVEIAEVNVWPTPTAADWQANFNNYANHAQRCAETARYLMEHNGNHLMIIKYQARAANLYAEARSARERYRALTL